MTERALYWVAFLVGIGTGVGLAIGLAMVEDWRTEIRERDVVVGMCPFCENTIGSDQL